MERSSRYSLSPILIGLVVAMLAALSGCSRPEAEEEIAAVEAPTIDAQVGEVTRRDLVDTLTVRGTVAAAPNEDVRVSALVPGRVVAMRVSEGDHVMAGQALAEIDPGPLEDERRRAEAGLEQAKSALENAEIKLERAQALFERGIAAGKEVDDAKAEQAAAQASVTQAAAALDASERQVSRTRVTSPITGYVIKRLIAVGEQVDGTAAQPLVEIANLANVEMAAEIPSEYLSRVHVGQTAEVTTDAYRDRRFGGEVIAIAPSIDPANNSALARVRIPNPQALLKIGMFAQGRVQIGRRKGAVVVPPSALSKENGVVSVYVVSGNLAQRRTVTTGLETSDAVEILSGLSEGEKILISGVHGLGERARLGGAL